MASDANRLLAMSQAELDASFSAREVGPIPNGEARGTAIVAPRTAFSPAALVNFFPSNWDAKPLIGFRLDFRAAAGA